MGLSGATRERVAYVQRSAGSRGNKRGRRVSAIVGAGLCARIRSSISAARSSMVYLPVPIYRAAPAPRAQTAPPARLDV
eukprot:1136311-Pleurochrysis_carterae.AAC.5